MESAYLSSEIALLHVWNIVKDYAGQSKKVTPDCEAAFFSCFSAHQQICTEFLGKNVLPHVSKLHGLSSAVRASCSLDINLKLFDLLGRLGLDGIWAYWGLQRLSKKEAEAKERSLNEVRMYTSAVKELVSNNPALLLPVKDDLYRSRLLGHGYSHIGPDLWVAPLGDRCS